MRLLAASILVLAVAIFGGSVVVARALEAPTGPNEIEVIQEACKEVAPNDMASCVLDTLDDGP